MKLVPILDYTDDEGCEERDNFITKLPHSRLDDETKDKVLSYLNNIDFVRWWSGPISFTSPFTGDSTRITGNVFDDGVYKWDCHLPVYVRDNDVALPDAFIERVQAFFVAGNTATPVCSWNLPTCDSSMILTLDGYISIEEYNKDCHHLKQ